MASEYRFLELPLDVEVSVKEVPAGFDLDTEALALLDKAIKVHVDNAAVDGWVPTGPVDAQSLIATDRLRFDDRATLFGKKIRFVKVSLELKPATEETPSCPSCGSPISRFDVYGRACKFYLPDRPLVPGLADRLSRSWQYCLRPNGQLSLRLQDLSPQESEWLSRKAWVQDFLGWPAES